MAVNPRNTSQMCSGCGTPVKKDLHQRQHDCSVGGLSLRRDPNASINLLKSGTDAVFQMLRQLAAA
jgi:putative transposase